MPANGLRTRSGDFPSFQMGLPFRDGVAGAMASPSVEGVFFAPVCFGYGAARRTGTLPLSDGDLEDTTASLFSDSAELRSAEEWLAQLDWAASKTSVVQKRQKSTFEDVRKLLVQILPDVNDIRIAAPTETRPLPRVEFETPFGWTPLRSLGFGYQSLITWMVDFASHMVELYPDSHDPLAEPAVVLVDEIDLHLHATWQRDLMAYLTKRFPNTQFIVTAHSPLIVQAAAEVDANIALLRREGDHVVIDNDIEAVRGWRVDQVLTSDLFGLPSARPPALDGIIKRREEILLKPRVSKADQAELARLEKQIGWLPAGETAAEAAKNMRLVEETLELLRKKP
ncbi:MAG TPA: AAA family ATPase [Pirellulales bacterium]|nr:AAA family ATPase [Pirellulales bacterium]